MFQSYISEEHTKRSAWRSLWRSEDTRRKILTTLLLITIFRFLLHIPIPGINTTPDLVRENIVPGSGLYTMLDFLSMLSGSSLLNVSVLALGLLPFNLTSLLLQLMIPLIPSLQRRFEEDPREARGWFEKWNYYLAIPVAVFESFLFLFLISPNCEGRLFLLDAGTAQSGLLFTITTVTILVTGSFIAVWFAGLISEFGIRGQGNAILIVSGIIGQMSNEFVRLLRIQIETTATVEGSGLVLQLSQQIDSLLTEPGTIMKLFSYVILFVLCVFVVIYIQSGRRNVPVQYPGRPMNLYAMRKFAQRPITYLPLMLMISTDGLIGSQLMILLTTFYAPLITCTGIPWVNTAAIWVINILSEDNFWFAPIAFIIVVTFTFFYSNITFEQQNYGENLKRAGGQIPGVHSGAPTQKYLSRINSRITLVPALTLGMLAIAPWYFNLFLNTFGLSNINLDLLDAEKILIMVSVIRDSLQNIEAELLLHGYQERLLTS